MLIKFSSNYFLEFKPNLLDNVALFAYNSTPTNVMVLFISNAE